MHGIVVTAQCDLAHDKAKVVNYLPIVAVPDWEARQYSQLLLEALSNELNQKVRQFLRNAGVSEHLWGAISAERIIGDVLRPRSEEKAVRKVIPKLEETFSQLAILDEKGTDSPLNRSVLAAMVDMNPKLAGNITQRLVTNELAGYYFLPALEPGEGGTRGYVVLLRHVYHMSQEDCRALGVGAEQISLGPVQGDRLAMPVSQLKPPFLQHLVQMFAFLFSRIGVEDIQPDVVTTVVEGLPRQARD